MPFPQYPSLKETWAICLPRCLLTQANNKPSAGSEHERLKWYTVWKLSIQLLMSKIQGCRGQSCHLSQEEVIITLPLRGSRYLCLSFTQEPAPVPAATGQTSFRNPEQCPTKCLANPHNPLYSSRAGRMGPRRGPRWLCVRVPEYVCVWGQGVNFKPAVLQARWVIISLTAIKVLLSPSACGDVHAPVCSCAHALSWSGVYLVNKWEIRVRYICSVSLIYIWEMEQRGAS